MSVKNDVIKKEKPGRVNRQAFLSFQGGVLLPLLNRNPGQVLLTQI